MDDSEAGSGISPDGESTVYKLIHEDRIPFHKALTGYRFDTAELNEWVKSGGAALRDVRPKGENEKPCLE